MLHHRQCMVSLLTAVCFLIGSVLLPASASAARDDWHYVPKDDDCNKSEPVSQPVSEPSGATGSWSELGSEKHQLLQAVFDTITKTYGGSGAFAAGVMGNLVHESGLIPDIAEYYDAHNKGQTKVTDGVPSADPTGRTLRFGMNGTKPVNGMARYANHEGGGGLFQFTPFTKFTSSDDWQKLSGDGWAPANQIAYVMDNAIINRQIEHYMTSTNQSYGAASYGKPVRFHNVEELMSTDSPRLAAEAFYVGYERGAKYHPEREDSAVAINEQFNTSDVKADKSKWHLTKGDDANKKVTIDKTSSSIASAHGECHNQDDTPTVLNASDYTGSTGITLAQSGWGQPIRRTQLPDKLKQYAIDPTQLGLKLHDCSGWTRFTGTQDSFLNGQCVALSKALFRSLWLKDGEDGPAFTGNGNELAQAAADAWGGETSSQPSFGAVASLNVSGSSAGHTYIVSHVFKNGDILIIEQNTAGYSGADNHEQCSWNYRLQSKAAYESQHTVFFTPVRNGGALNPKMHTVNSK